MIDVRKELKSGKKVRMESWWWGRYISGKGESYFMNDRSGYPTNQTPIGKCDKWEIYSEEKHGKHHRDDRDAYWEDKFEKEMGYGN